MNNSVFTYQGNAITFQKGDSVMVNATQMAKPFNKSANHWLRNQQTKEFIETLSRLRNRNLADLVQVTNGGNDNGTWFHEDVAMEFARWLSPAFAIWCNDRIKELMRTGVTTTLTDDDAIMHALEILRKRVASERQRVQALEGENELLTSENKSLAPKAQYTDAVLLSASTYTFTQVSKDLSMRSVHTFTKWLQGEGIIYKQSGQWMPVAKYSELGYFATRTARYVKSDDTVGTRISTVITEQGRKWLHTLRDKQVTKIIN